MCFCKNLFIRIIILLIFFVFIILILVENFKMNHLNRTEPCLVSSLFFVISLVSSLNQIIFSFKIIQTKGSSVLNYQICARVESWEFSL
jgi:phosphoglycerol transferase MdoB-like AlkP superfamily enzyme